MNEEDFSKAEIDAIEAACKRIENMMKVCGLTMVWLNFLLVKTISWNIKVYHEF